MQWTTSNYYRCSCEKDHEQKIDVTTEQSLEIKTLLDQKDFFEDYFQAYLNYGAGHTDTMVIKKDLLISAGLFKEKQLRMNDYDMWFRIAYLDQPIGFVHEPLAVYHLDIPNSIVKTYKDAENIDGFVEHHLELAARTNMLEKFKPCAKSMLGWWVQERIKEKNGKQARIILKKYKHLFELYCWTTTYIRSFFPRISSVYESIKKSTRPNK